LIAIVVAACGSGGSAGDEPAAAPPSAAQVAARLGRPARLLLGLGSTAAADVQAQGIAPDLFDHYLVGVGANSWRSWNSPDGAFVDVFAGEAESVGAVPMYT